MNHKDQPKTYRAMIGRLDTRQFGVLQQYLAGVNEIERYAMLFRQLEKEIELDAQDNLLQPLP